MANHDKIKDYEFKPGQSGNPNGRPPGRLNSKTILNKYLHLVVEMKNPYTQQMEKIPISDAVGLSLISQALKGNVQAIKEIFDRTEGKSNQRVELANPDDESFEVAVSNPNASGIDLNKLPDDVLIAVINAKRNTNGEETADKSFVKKTVTSSKKSENGAKGKGKADKKA